MRDEATALIDAERHRPVTRMLRTFTPVVRLKK